MSGHSVTQCWRVIPAEDLSLKGLSFVDSVAMSDRAVAGVMPTILATSDRHRARLIDRSIRSSRLSSSDELRTVDRDFLGHAHLLLELCDSVLIRNRASTCEY